ncbi:MAG: DUF47 domain-containing protein [Acidimicrobiales bacterium]
MIEDQTGSNGSLWRRLVKFTREFGPEVGRELVGMLLEHLDVDAEGVALVHAMLRGEVDHDAATERMREIEHRGDDLRSELVSLLTRTLVTPLDREDIYRLSRSIDDVLDGLRDFVRECALLDSPDPGALGRVLDALAASIVEMRAAVVTIGDHPNTASPEVLSAQRSANRVRIVHQDEIAALFVGEITMGTLGQRELLHRLDAVGLHLVEAGHIIADSFVKRGE